MAETSIGITRYAPLPDKVTPLPDDLLNLPPHAFLATFPDGIKPPPPNKPYPKIENTAPITDILPHEAESILAGVPWSNTFRYEAPDVPPIDRALRACVRLAQAAADTDPENPPYSVYTVPTPPDALSAQGIYTAVFIPAKHLIFFVPGKPDVDMPPNFLAFETRPKTKPHPLQETLTLTVHTLSYHPERSYPEEIFRIIEALPDKEGKIVANLTANVINRLIFNLATTTDEPTFIGRTSTVLERAVNTVQGWQWLSQEQKNRLCADLVSGLLCIADNLSDHIKHKQHSQALRNRGALGEFLDSEVVHEIYKNEQFIQARGYIDLYRGYRDLAEAEKEGRLNGSMTKAYLNKIDGWLGNIIGNKLSAAYKKELEGECDRVRGMIRHAHTLPLVQAVGYISDIVAAMQPFYYLSVIPDLQKFFQVHSPGKSQSRAVDKRDRRKVKPVAADQIDRETAPNLVQLSLDGEFGRMQLAYAMPLLQDVVVKASDEVNQFLQSMIDSMAKAVDRKLDVSRHLLQLLPMVREAMAKSALTVDTTLSNRMRRAIALFLYERKGNPEFGDLHIAIDPRFSELTGDPETEKVTYCVTKKGGSVLVEYPPMQNVFRIYLNDELDQPFRRKAVHFRLI